MEKDKPSLPKIIDNLNKELKKHNSQVKEVYKLIDNIISDSFRKPSSPVSQIFYKINKGDIKELAGKSWKYVFKNVIESENIQKFESNIDDYINNHLKRMKSDENELIISNTKIWSGNMSELDDMERIFKNEIVKNKTILKKLIDIADKKIVLNDCIKEIQNSSTSIYTDIDKKVYTTNAKCCPTVWKSIVESFRLPF